MVQDKTRQVNNEHSDSCGPETRKARKKLQDRYDREVASAIEKLMPARNGRKPVKIYRHGYYGKPVTFLLDGIPVTATVTVARLKYFYDDGMAPASETATFFGTLFLKWVKATKELLVSMIRDNLLRKKPVEAAAGLHGSSQSGYYRLKRRLVEAARPYLEKTGSLQGFLSGTFRSTARDHLAEIYGTYVDIQIC